VGAVGAVAGAAALGAAAAGAAYPYCRYYPYPPCYYSDEMTVAGALFIAPALRHGEDAI
jgi:hypothetical protein